MKSSRLWRRETKWITVLSSRLKAPRGSARGSLLLILLQQEPTETPLAHPPIMAVNRGRCLWTMFQKYITKSTIKPNQITCPQACKWLRIPLVRTRMRGLLKRPEGKSQIQTRLSIGIIIIMVISITPLATTPLKCRMDKESKLEEGGAPSEIENHHWSRNSLITTFPGTNTTDSLVTFLNKTWSVTKELGRT